MCTTRGEISPFINMISTMVSNNFSTDFDQLIYLIVDSNQNDNKCYLNLILSDIFMKILDANREYNIPYMNVWIKTFINVLQKLLFLFKFILFCGNER